MHTLKAGAPRRLTRRGTSHRPQSGRGSQQASGMCESAHPGRDKGRQDEKAAFLVQVSYRSKPHLRLGDTPTLTYPTPKTRTVLNMTPAECALTPKHLCILETVETAERVEPNRVPACPRPQLLHTHSPQGKAQERDEEGRPIPAGDAVHQQPTVI